MAEAACALLEGKTCIKTPRFSNFLDDVDFRYLLILSQANQRVNLLELYEELDLLLEKHKIHDPLIPRLEQLKKPKHRLHVLVAKIIFSREQSKPSIQICEKTRTLSLDGKRWSFSKNPKTWALVCALSKSRDLSPGLSHDILDKKQIHEALSDNKYVERLHDARVWMLLRRFRTQMIEKWDIDPLYLPGDRKIYLRISFMRMN